MAGGQRGKARFASALPMACGLGCWTLASSMASAAARRFTVTARGRPPSAATLRHVYKLMRNALADAYRMELVTRNVATQVKPPPLSRERRPGMTIDDARRLLDVLTGEGLEAFYVLALTTGLR